MTFNWACCFIASVIHVHSPSITCTLIHSYVYNHCILLLLVSPYDIPFARMDYPVNFSNSATPLSPNRFSSLTRMPPGGFHYDRGHYSAASDRGGYSPYHQHSIVAMPMKEDVSGLWYFRENISGFKLEMN